MQRHAANAMMKPTGANRTCRGQELQSDQVLGLGQVTGPVFCSSDAFSLLNKPSSIPSIPPIVFLLRTARTARRRCKRRRCRESVVERQTPDVPTRVTSGEGLHRRTRRGHVRAQCCDRLSARASKKLEPDGAARLHRDESSRTVFFI